MYKLFNCLGKYCMGIKNSGRSKANIWRQILPRSDWPRWEDNSKSRSDSKWRANTKMRKAKWKWHMSRKSHNLINIGMRKWWNIKKKPKSWRIKLWEDTKPKWRSSKNKYNSRSAISRSKLLKLSTSRKYNRA